MLIRFQSDSVLSARGFQAVFSYMPHGLGGINFCSTSKLCLNILMNTTFLKNAFGPYLLKKIKQCNSTDKA